MTTLARSLLHSPILGLADPEASVDAGRKALDKWYWSRYPWYDSDTDAVRRIEVSEPWFWEWLWSLLNSIRGRLRISWPGTLLEWITWIGIAGLLILLVYLLVRAYLDRAGRRRASRVEGGAAEGGDDLARIESLPFPVKAARLDLLAKARRHYQQGEYGEAVKYLFSYQLVQLDKHQWIRLTRGKTNRQYLGEIGPHGGVRRLLEQTMVAFEDFFFGNLTIDLGVFFYETPNRAFEGRIYLCAKACIRAELSKGPGTFALTRSFKQAGKSLDQSVEGAALG